MMLLVALMCAPWCGVVPDDLDLIHRIEAEGIPINDFETADHVTAVCGAHVKLIGDLQWKDLRTRGTRHRRCPECRGAR